MSASDTDFQEQQELNEILQSWSVQHCCKEADCQIYPDGTRRRNPYPDEADAAPLIPHIETHQEKAKDSKYSRKRTGLARAKKLWKKHRKGELT